MIKFVLAALWISAVTAGAVLMAARPPSEPGEAGEPPPPMMGGLDFVKTEIISVPVVREGAVSGYFLARLVYTAEPEKLAKLSVPADILLTDAVYTALYSRPDIDVTAIASFDIEAFRASLRDGINARVGDTLVHEVMVEQVDFLTKADIRNNSLRRASPDARNVRKSGAPAGGEEAEHAPAH